MRILIHDRPGHPFEVQLSRELARRGHTVMHSYGAFFQSPRGVLNKSVEDPESLAIIGLELGEPFQKYGLWRRVRQEMKYGRILAAHIQSFNPDIVIFANTPSEAMTLVYWRLRRSRIRFLYWVQDFYSLAVQKILSKRSPLAGKIVGQLYIWMDKYLLRQSDKIILITEDFVPLLVQWGVDSGKTVVIPNWATIDDLPVLPKQNDWSADHELEDKFCFLYSGTLGMKHNPGMLVALAQAYVDDTQVRIVVVSEGLGADWLREEKARLKLDNLVLLNYQPFADLPQVFAAADVLVAVLEPDAGVFSVPSKVLSYLCAQRPLLLAVPEENLAARIVQQNEAGLVVAPDDVDGFLAQAGKLYEDVALRERLGRNGRLYAESHFDIQTIAAKFEAVTYDIQA